MNRVFVICGDSGSGKTTLASFISNRLDESTTVECDRYHKWERGHEMWGKMTHLNPQANNVDLMIEDIKNLKEGRSILRREYDHSAGTFTDKEEIKPSKNVIVCGLHTFYCPKETSDFKIFMDTVQPLKTQWKMARDTGQRGYKPSQVQHQIARRKKDYFLFLAPHIEDADLIVNFCSEDMSHVDSVKGIGRYLKIFIKKSYDMKGIIEDFHNSGVEAMFYSSGVRKNFHEITIKNCKNNSHYYYDYVMICILNMVGEND